MSLLNILEDTRTHNMEPTRWPLFFFRKRKQMQYRKFTHVAPPHVHCWKRSLACLWLRRCSCLHHRTRHLWLWGSSCPGRFSHPDLMATHLLSRTFGPRDPRWHCRWAPTSFQLQWWRLEEAKRFVVELEKTHHVFEKYEKSPLRMPNSFKRQRS